MNTEEIEKEIHHLIETEIDGDALSNRLFSQDDGLFGKLGPTRPDRERVVKSALFRKAQERLWILRHAELEFIRRKNKPEVGDWKLLCGALVKERDELRYELDSLRKELNRTKRALVEQSCSPPPLPVFIEQSGHAIEVMPTGAPPKHDEFKQMLRQLFDSAAAKSIAVICQLDAEPEMARFLNAVKIHPEERAFVVQLFTESLGDTFHLKQEPWYFLQYCMHGLRWDEIREFIVAKRHEDVERRGSRCSQIWIEILDSFEDNWENAKYFREFNKQIA